MEKRNPIIGKTFSLYGREQTSDNYYSVVSLLTDDLIKEFNGELNLLQILRDSSRKRFPKKNQPELFNILKSSLSKYLTGLNFHLENLSLAQRFESALRTSEFHYYLYMIEAELTNRISKLSFIVCETKLAFLPHCLHDLNKECKAKLNGLDYQCPGCSNNCFLNEVSKLLKQKNIEPYIWRQANLKSIIKNYKRNGVSLGVLGIACIPELINGMRSCSKAAVPVVGIPLDANRCARWMGAFYENSVNLDRLKKLISSN